MQDIVTRLLIIESNSFFQQGLNTFFAGVADFDVINIVESLTDGIEYSRTLQPDLVLLDMTLVVAPKAISQTLSAIRASCPKVRVVMWGDNENSNLLADIMMACPDGYLSRRQPMAELLLILRQVCEGRNLLCTKQPLTGLAMQLHSRATLSASSVPRLTRRERQVLDLLSKGYSNTEIAALHGTKYSTVSASVSRILTKLQVSNRTQAVVKANQLGLIPQIFEHSSKLS